MEHMVNFGIVIDDESIKKMVEANVVEQVSADILKEVEKNPGDLPTVSKFQSLAYRNVAKRIEWQKLLKDAVEEMAEEWKDEVVERAAEMLFDSLKRTKKYKDKMAEVLDG